MCTGLEILMVASSAMSAMGQMKQGQEQKEMYNAQAQQSLNDAAYKADAYKSQAEKIRKAGKAQVGEANAALAASGVKLGEGTPLEIKKAIVQNSEEDALTALLNGSRTTTAAQEQAQLLGKAGDNAATNSYYGAAGSVLSAGASLGKGWKNAAKYPAGNNPDEWS